jgi:DNA-binding transcriptional LysR family regulator
LRILAYFTQAAPAEPFPGRRFCNILGEALRVEGRHVERSAGTDLVHEQQPGNDLSPKTWRLYDLGAKHAFLLAGLGWGGMPLGVVEADLASGALVPLALEDMDASLWMAMSAIYRTDSPPGPAGRWLIDRLKRTVGEERMPDCTSGSMSPASGG